MTQDHLKLVIARLIQSDKQALEQLVDLYYNRLMGFAMPVVKSHDVAEEVVMDAFMKLWEQRSTLADVRNLETYMYVMVRNLSLNYLRKQKVSFFEVLEDDHLTLARYEQTPEGTLITTEMLEQVNQAVDALPPKCKLIFKLLREDGVSRKEAAEILNISVKTIDNQIAIAVERIAKALAIDLSSKSNRSGLQLFLLMM